MQLHKTVDSRDAFRVASVSEFQKKAVGGFIAGICDHAPDEAHCFLCAFQVPLVNLVIDRRHDEQFHDAG